MTFPRSARAIRFGFTLIEMLVVIAIIAVLMGLLLPAVLPLLSKGPEAVAATEISQLTTAVQNFQNKFKSGPFPSRVKLCEFYGDYNQNSQLDKDSIAFLTKMFPGILNKDVNLTTKNQVLWMDRGIDWNGNGKYEQGAAGIAILEGDQCLVFFLGGIPTSAGGANGCLGFSTNNRDPAQQGGDRVGPIFEFDGSRLLQLHGNAFFSYNDAFLKKPPNPYAYFSSYGSRNGYNRYFGQATPPLPINVSDCNSLGVWPYMESLVPTERYLNPETCQIISAGLDGKWGQGSNKTLKTGVPTWTRANANSSACVTNNSNAGIDDRSNFYGRRLGVPE
jgi:prepilin-type N-terminal cleavage/methylation domain-containing protein